MHVECVCFMHCHVCFIGKTLWHIHTSKTTNKNNRYGLQLKQSSSGNNTAGGHTASNAPDLFRPPKLSGAGPG